MPSCLKNLQLQSRDENFSLLAKGPLLNMHFDKKSRRGNTLACNRPVLHAMLRGNDNSFYHHGDVASTMVFEGNESEAMFLSSGM